MKASNPSTPFLEESQVEQPGQIMDIDPSTTRDPTKGHVQESKQKTSSSLWNLSLIEAGVLYFGGVPLAEILWKNMMRHDA